MSLHTDHASGMLVNDSYGHLTGDEVLVAFTRLERRNRIVAPPLAASPPEAQRVLPLKHAG